MEKLKVIIVDDDKLLGTTLVLGLEGLSMKPYYLDSLDGLLDKISEVQPNILVLDIEVGMGNGIEKLKELKSAILQSLSDVLHLDMRGHDDDRNVDGMKLQFF